MVLAKSSSTDQLKGTGLEEDVMVKEIQQPAAGPDYPPLEAMSTLTAKTKSVAVEEVKFTADTGRKGKHIVWFKGLFVMKKCLYTQFHNVLR